MISGFKWHMDPLSPHQLNKQRKGCKSWTHSDKTFWIPASEHNQSLKTALPFILSLSLSLSLFLSLSQNGDCKTRKDTTKYTTEQE